MFFFTAQTKQSHATNIWQLKCVMLGVHINSKIFAGAISISCWFKWNHPITLERAQARRMERSVNKLVNALFDEIVIECILNIVIKQRFVYMYTLLTNLITELAFPYTVSTQLFPSSSSPLMGTQQIRKLLTVNKQKYWLD